MKICFCHVSRIVLTLFGLFEYRKMPLGLRNASQTFRKYIDSVLYRATCYVGDILIFPKSKTEHEYHLTHTLNILCFENMAINKVKCNFSSTCINFLRFEISVSGITPSQEQIQANHFSQPSRKSLRSNKIHRNCHFL